MLRWLTRSRSDPVGKGGVSPFDTSHLESGLGKRTASSAATTLVSSVLTFAIQIAQLAILSRLLTPEDFGLVGMAIVATGFIRLFADIGLATATMQRDEIDQAFVSALFYIDLIVATGLMLLCLAIAPLSASVFSEPRVAVIIGVVALTFPLVALRGQHQALLARRMFYVRINITRLASSILAALAATLSAWWFELGYWSIVIGIVVGDVSLVLFSWIASPWMPSRPGSLAAGKSALGFGLNLLGANIAGWLWKQADRAFIGWRWDASELGYYTRAYSVLMVPLNLVSGPIGSAVIPALSRLQNKPAEWTALMLTAARAMAFFSGLLTLGLALNAHYIILLLLGPDWSYSETIFSLLALSLFPSFIWEHSRFVFISRGRTDVMRNYAVGAAIVHVAAFAIGVSWGAVGVAISLAIASALVTPVLLVVAARVSECSVWTLTIQSVPSLIAMLAVWGLAWLAAPMFSEDAGLWETCIKSAAIVLAYCGVHLIALPFFEGWRSDIRRVWAFAIKHMQKGASDEAA
ncbi:lipopolysaccharide biosynthesis protein [Erythrobacter sp. F6033]|uniref:lipopolysaccharide biosynthesis protein n=1 Tax=Erythrobacter sp. F6033 TaxID=2926401 RepID=UPI001FF3961C|nr:lipopolysaccharide biosynthesis protein [Erythrobacter sp. F6033]MCK0129801.1 lipopolysaccharide biosynthesis protein [Erythrobacter sp. F6033]